MSNSNSDHITTDFLPRKVLQAFGKALACFNASAGNDRAAEDLSIGVGH